MVKTSRAAVIPEPNAPVEIREFEIPELEPGAALFKVGNAGVCGTDVHLWHGKLAGVPYPLIPGHEMVGTIEAAGPKKIKNVDGHEIKPGDRVTIHDVTKTCYSCWFCLNAKAPTKCPNREVYGITIELGGAITAEHGVGLSKIGYLEMAFNKTELDLMKKIKKMFDPHNILNPGKIFSSL